MALLLNDPCDNFTDAPWVTAGSPTIVAGGFVGNGFSIPASATATVSYDVPAPQQTDQLTIGFRIKFSAIPGSYVPFLNWMSDAGATSHVTLRIYNPSGQLAFTRTSGNVNLGTPTFHGMVTGTWYYVEASLRLSDTAGQGIVRKDGTVLYATGTTEDTKSAGTKTVFDRIRFQGATGLAYIVDDIYVRNDLTFGAAFVATGTGAITFAGSAVATVAAAGTGAITFAGSGTATILVRGTGAITFAGSGVATVTALIGTARLTFDGSGLATTTGGVITGTGAIIFGGYGGPAVTGPTRGHITFNGYGDADVAPRLDVYAPPEWAWLVLRPDGTPVGPLTAATGRKLTLPLDGVPTASFTMPGDHPQLATIAELATDLYVTRNGRALFRGRIGGSSETHAAANDTVTLTAIGYRGLLAHRLVWPTSQLEFAGVDQADIAWRLIADTQALGDLRITRGIGDVTGVVRERTFTAGIAVAQAIQGLAGVADGFDWEVDAQLALNVFHPQRGRYPADVPSSQPILTYGRDVVAVTTTVDPSRYASAVYFTGSQETEPAAPVGAIGDAGRWELQKADPNATLQTTVDEEAAAELSDASELPSAIVVTLAADIWNPYVLWLGDRVRALISVGRLDLDVRRRIVQIDVALDDTGVETVALAIGASPPKLSDRLTSLQDQITQLQLATGSGSTIGGGPDGGGPDGGGGDGGGIKEITSSDGSIVVTNPTGPTTNLVLASGGLITVLNPTGPIVDLTLGGGAAGGEQSVSVVHTVALRYLSDSHPLPDDPQFSYFRSFGSNAWLEEVSDLPGMNGTRSRITQPGYYSAVATFSVDVPLTIGSPGSTTLESFVDPGSADWVVDWQDPYGPPGAFGGNISIYVGGWRKQGHTPEDGYSALDIANGRFAGVALYASLFNPWVNGDGSTRFQDAVVTVTMTLTRKPP